MKSWKARLLILATMLAMLIALATPAVAYDEDDFEDAVAFCLWLGYEPDDDEFWDCVDDYLAWADDDDGSAEEAPPPDDGSGYGGYGYDPWLYGYW